jgi:tRNA threonylcarbamoyladenosine biosynthesis protein TsaB
MLILGIDTSTSWESVAVCDDMRMLSEFNCKIPSSHSSHLMKNIDGLLASLEVAIHDIELIVVSIGPGSFTGLRIGIATAKTLSYSLDCPLIGVSSLEALATFASMTAKDNSHIVSLIDAKRNEVYIGRFHFQHGDTIQQADIGISSVQSLLSSLDGNTIICGTGAISYYSELVQSGVNYHLLTAEIFSFPHAYILANIGLKNYNVKGSDDHRTLCPIYIRPPDIRKNPLTLKKKR